MSSPVLSRQRLDNIFRYLDQAAVAAGAEGRVTLPLSMAVGLLRDAVLVDVAVEPIAANDNTEPLRAA